MSEHVGRALTLKWGSGHESVTIHKQERKKEAGVRIREPLSTTGLKRVHSEAWPGNKEFPVRAQMNSTFAA